MVDKLVTSKTVGELLASGQVKIFIEVVDGTLAKYIVVLAARLPSADAPFTAIMLLMLLNELNRDPCIVTGRPPSNCDSGMRRTSEP